MPNGPQPTDVIAQIPATVPFVAPETIERQMGQTFELRLGANESLFGPSPRAVEAMAAASARGHFYGDPEALELRGAIAAREGCAIENVLLASGIDELLMLFARAYVGPGDPVATTYGSYPTFEYAITSVGGRLVHVPYRDYSVDLEALAAVPARLAYLANPDNPSSTWKSRSEVSAFFGSLPEDRLLLLDEAYSDFAPELEPFDGSLLNVVRLRTFSKAHGMAGIRIGYALAQPDLLTPLNKVRMHFGVSNVAQAGALASYLDVETVSRVVRETEAARDWLVGEMAGAGVASLASRTNFLCVDLGSREAAEALLLKLRERRVFIRKPGLPPLDRFVRVSVGSREVMERFWEIGRELFVG